MSLASITRFWNSLLDVPATDPDDARRRKLLNIILLGVIALTGIFIFVVTPTSAPNFEQLDAKQKNDILLLVYTNIGVFVGSTLFYLINRFISGWLASSLFLIFLLVAISLSDSPAELTNGRSLFVYTAPIIMASMLLYSWASFILAGLSTLTLIILARGIGTQPNELAIIGYFFIAFISWLSSRTLEQALSEVRAINAGLDRVVAERTHALSEALAREHIEAGRNQAILDSIADGVIVFDAQQVSILANPALSHLTGKPLESLTGMHLSDFIMTEELSPNSQGMIKRLIERLEKVEAAFRVQWGRRTLSFTIARVMDTTANINIGTVVVFRDITRETELEKMKETFVGVVSHELRTPLNAIMGYTEMIKEMVLGPITEKQAEALERIMVNLKRLFLMIGDLLDEAQIKAGKLSIKKAEFKTLTLLENLHVTLYKIAIDQGLYLTSEIDPDVPATIIGDQQRLQQIILNLVNNSIKFTKNGGVHTRIARAGSNHWQIEVDDTGVGIPATEIPHIFDTFRQIENPTTRKHGGFGLGLSIVKQLVELMNGEVTVRSEVNKGSTFTVRLPLQ